MKSTLMLGIVFYIAASIVSLSFSIPAMSEGVRLGFTLAWLGSSFFVNMLSYLQTGKPL